MTRVAIVAGSEELRAALAAALRADPAFDVVSATASADDASRSADVVLVARAPRNVSSRTTQAAGTPARDGSLLESHPLTNREREILALLADGLGNKQIAAQLGISTNTVKTHLELLFDKLGASSRAEAVAIGVRRGALLL